jgi:methionyl-tRNA formyltransferase
VYAQSAAAIAYPIKVKQAYEKLAGCYTEVARRVITSLAAERLQADLHPQDERLVSYSVWRSPDDYAIDWNWPSSKIRRFVDAVGWPYQGARATFSGGCIIVDDVEEAAERQFEDRHPGKIWRVDDGVPEVICGSGMIRIVLARDQNRERVRFTRVRDRFTR